MDLSAENALRLMTYNMMNGGRGDTPERLPDIGSVVRDVNPDLLVLQEANGMRDPARLARFERLTGLKGTVAPADSGFHVAAFVRPNAVGTHIFPLDIDMRHAAICVEAELDDESADLQGASKVPVIGLHLEPIDPEGRLEEIKEVLDRFDTSKPVVVMGDMNTLAPERKYSLDRAPHEIRRRHANPRTGELDTRVMDAIKRAGLVDLHDLATRDVPEATVPTKLAGEEFVPTRMDYVFASLPIAALTRSARVVRSPLAGMASDHYPLVVELDLALKIEPLQPPGVSFSHGI